MLKNVTYARFQTGLYADGTDLGPVLPHPQKTFERCEMAHDTEAGVLYVSFSILGKKGYIGVPLGNIVLLKYAEDPIPSNPVKAAAAA